MQSRAEDAAGGSMPHAFARAWRGMCMRRPSVRLPPYREACWSGRWWRLIPTPCTPRMAIARVARGPPPARLRCQSLNGCAGMATSRCRRTGASRRLRHRPRARNQRIIDRTEVKQQGVGELSQSRAELLLRRASPGLEKWALRRSRQAVVDDVFQWRRRMRLPGVGRASLRGDG